MSERTSLGRGEGAAILLAKEVSADRLLVDDRSARREAGRRKLPILGTVAVLLLAKKRGILPSVKRVLDGLRVCGTRIGDTLHSEALKAAGE
jgi:predicted nucleic acid-binding protein